MPVIPRFADSRRYAIRIHLIFYRCLTANQLRGQSNFDERRYPIVFSCDDCVSTCCRQMQVVSRKYATRLLYFGEEMLMVAYEILLRMVAYCVL